MKTNKEINGFTLIELMVVVATIGVLMSISLPTIRKAKGIAEKVICKSNLRQAGIANSIYLEDNNNWFADPQQSLYKNWPQPGNSDPYCIWHDPDYNLTSHPEEGGPIWEYLESQGVLTCPTFKRMAKKYGKEHLPYHNPNIPIEPQWGYSINGTLDKVMGIERLDDVRNPHKTIYMTEESIWPIPGVCNDTLNDSVIVPYWGTIPSEPIILPFPGGDSIATFHDGKQKDPTTQAETNLHTLLKTEKRNQGVANGLYLDGHVDTVEPSQTITALNPF